MGKKRKPSYGENENKELMAALQELRRSGAAGTHKDKRDKRARTRAAAKKRARADWDE